MKQKDVEYLFRKMGATKFKISGDWVMTSCVLAKWTHAHGTDHNPSMGALVAAGMSPAHCFSCGFKGGMLTLVQEYFGHAIGDGTATIEDRQAALEYLLLAEEDTEGIIVAQEQDKVAVVPDDLASYLGVYHPYFEERGISQTDAKLWNLGYIEKVHFEAIDQWFVRRAMFPLYDASVANGRLIGAVGRSIDGEEPKYKNCPPKLKKSELLYGLWLQPSLAKRLVVVEGAIDAIRINSYLRQEEGLHEYWAVAMLGADPSMFQIDLLADHAYEIILMLDNDEAGRKGQEKLIDALEDRKVLSVIDWPKGLKDPDEAGYEAIELIRERRSVLEQRLSRLFKV